MTGNAAIPEHGTLSRAKYHRCPCDECKAFLAAYQRRRYRMKGYGTWQPLVDAGPAREHLLALNADGYSWAVIAKHLGRHTAAITGIVYELSRGRRRRIRPEFASQILAVQGADLTPGLVPALGTVRRIRALNAAGWPNRLIGDRIGTSRKVVGQMTRQKFVTPATARAVADCYEELKRLCPEEHGVEAWAVLRVQRSAVRAGWRDPLWWEDWGGIDDPGFNPATVEHGLSRNELGALRRKEVEHLMSFGLDADVISGRLGMATTTVQTIMTEVRTGVRRQRSGVAA